MEQPSVDLAMLLKALADTKRLQILARLMEQGETCVCELVETLECSPQALSFHLSKLKAVGLIRERRAGKWMFYRPDPDGLARAHDRLHELLDVGRIPDAPAPGSLSAMCSEGCLPANRDQLRKRRIAQEAKPAG